MESIEDQMLYISFNQTNSAFAIGTERGFRIYNTYPYKDYYERILEGGIGIVEMLYNSNILALVGGGKYPKYSRNKVILWDDHQAKVIAELSFTTYIKNVKMKKEKIIIVCDTKIYIFNLINFQNIDTVDTFENTKGIIAITYDPDINLLAYPDKASGYVKLKNYEKNENVLINVHNSKVAFLALSKDGVFLATASEKGTYIRIFRTDNGLLLFEYQTGSEICQISCITFDNSVDFFCCNASTGTVCIFSLAPVYTRYRESLKEDEKKSSSSLIKDADKRNEVIATRVQKSFWERLKIFDSSDSPWAEFKLPEPKSISAFCSKNSIVVISSEGRYYVAKFDPSQSGKCTKTEELSLNLTSNLY